MSRRPRGPVATLAGGMLASVVALTSAATVAQDVVHLTSQDGEAATRVRGEVVDFTGRQLLLKTATGREQSIPSHRVERIDTTYSAEHRAADALFDKRAFRQALDQYRLALSATREPRDWVRRRILAQIVWCHRSLGQPDQAGEYFLILLSRDPTTPDFACIPLAWTDAPPPPAVVPKAQAWLADAKNPAADLIGASLLVASDQKAAALDHLKRLATDADARIAWLAQAQLWRAQAATATTAQLRSWSEVISAHDSALVAGAQFLVGTALARSEPEAAALALLKLPILYPREHHLSAAALLLAGECLQQAGRKSQAAGLYRELVDQYEGLAEAAEARRRLRSLASNAPARDN